MDSVTGKASDYVADGVKLFLVYDFDGVFNVMSHGGTFKKSFYNPDRNERHPNPHYDEKAPRRRTSFSLWDNGGIAEPREPKTYEISWSTELIKDSNEISNRDDVQVIWLTTWRKHMDAVVDRLNFQSSREMLYLPWGDGHSAENHFLKVDAFQSFFRYVNDGSNSPASAIWVDDVVLDVSDEVSKSFLKGNFEDKGFTVCPDYNYGISREQMMNMKKFAEDS